MIYIYEVRTTGTGQHSRISNLRWKNPDSAKTGESTRAEMVRWIGGGGKAYVCGGGHLAAVGIVKADPPYLRTHADGVWTDNLLSLPRY